MKLIWKIAWRNILRHKGKSVIIGIILFLGSFVMTAGNAVLSGMSEGLQKHIVESVTGDLVIVSTNQKEDNVLTSSFSLKAIEPIFAYTNIREVLKKTDGVEKFMPIGNGLVSLLNEAGDMGFGYVYAVDIGQYRTMFPDNIALVEGRALSEGERGVMVNIGARENIYRQQRYWAVPVGQTVVESNLMADAWTNRADLDARSNLVFMGLSGDMSQLDIRSPIVGIFKFRYLNDFWPLILTDIESFRETLGYLTAAQKTVRISAEKEKYLNLDDSSLDDLFSAGSIETAATPGSDYDLRKLTRRSGSQKLDAGVDVDTGAYTAVLVKLKDSRDWKKAQENLTAALRAAGTDGRVLHWKKAAGQIGDFSTVIKGALNGFVVFIFFVAIIIIMNTLAMAAMERTNEIGMMRAVGAKKGFIASMFSVETAMLSAVFGGLGMVTGAVVSAVVAAFQITAKDNNILQLLFGGDSFHPMLTAPDILLGVVQLGLVTGFAMLYPIFIARRITPLDAISRD